MCSFTTASLFIFCMAIIAKVQFSAIDDSIDAEKLKRIRDSANLRKADQDRDSEGSSEVIDLIYGLQSAAIPEEQLVSAGLQTSLGLYTLGNSRLITHMPPSQMLFIFNAPSAFELRDGKGWLQSLNVELEKLPESAAITEATDKVGKGIIIQKIRELEEIGNDISQYLQHFPSDNRADRNDNSWMQIRCQVTLQTNIVNSLKIIGQYYARINGIANKESVNFNATMEILAEVGQQLLAARQMLGHVGIMVTQAANQIVSEQLLLEIRNQRCLNYDSIFVQIEECQADNLGQVCKLLVTDMTSVEKYYDLVPIYYEGFFVDSPVKLVQKHSDAEAYQLGHCEALTSVVDQCLDLVQVQEECLQESNKLLPDLSVILTKCNLTSHISQGPPRLLQTPDGVLIDKVTEQINLKIEGEPWEYFPIIIGGGYEFSYALATDKETKIGAYLADDYPHLYVSKFNQSAISQMARQASKNDFYFGILDFLNHQATQIFMGMSGVLLVLGGLITVAHGSYNFFKGKLQPKKVYTHKHRHIYQPSAPIDPKRYNKNLLKELEMMPRK